MKQIFISKSENDTLLIAKNLAKKFKGGEVVALNGDLGAGKTIFTKGIALGLKIKDLITSPTFTIMNSYFGALELFHFDMYRINDIIEAEETGIEECFKSGGVIVIEWAEKIKEILPKKIINVDILKLENETREITIDEYFNN